MTVLTPPAIFAEISRFDLAPVANTQSGGRSPFDGTEQTLEQPGTRWAATLAWEGLTLPEWRRLLAFLTRLNGPAGRFTWAPPLARQGTRTGGVVAGAGQTGTSLATSGWTGTGLALAEGDLVGWLDPTGRPALHMVVADANPGGGSTVTVAIAPPIRRSPADLAPLVLASPTAVWKLVQQRNGASVRDGMIGSLSIEIEEALV